MIIPYWHLKDLVVQSNLVIGKSRHIRKVLVKRPKILPVIMCANFMQIANKPVWIIQKIIFL